MYAIYSLTPAPWGDDYRYVEGFDYKDDAKKVMSCLNSVNINFNLYVIVDMDQPKMTKVDLKKMFETSISAPKKSKTNLQNTFRLKGTVTGRLSSKKPNLSNTPKSSSRVVSTADPYNGVVKF